MQADRPLPDLTELARSICEDVRNGASESDVIAALATLQGLSPAQATVTEAWPPMDYAPPLDDQGRMMRGTDHHYTVESIQARIAQLRRFADPEQSTQAEWDNLDWRGFCNTTRHIMSGLYAAIEPVRTTPPADAGAAIQDAKDAQRYRWLRSRLPGSAYRIAGVIYSEGGDGVDAAIDTAMGGEKL